MTAEDVDRLEQSVPPPEPAPASSRSGPARAPLPWWAALLLAAASGLLLVLAFPSELVPVGIWPAALVAPAGLLLALQGRRLALAALAGFVFFAAFYLAHISWMSQFLRVPGAEWVPGTALSVFMALGGALGAVLIALAYRWLPRAWPGAAGRLIVLPVAVAGLWTAREAAASTIPYGGFAWGRIGLSQGTGWLAELYSWLGVSGMTFLCVLIAAVGLAVVQELLRGGRTAALRAGAGLVAGAAALALVPSWPVDDAGSLRVAAVQGNGKTAYFDPPARWGDNLAAQVAATEPAYGEEVDVVVWPEGGSDLDPLRSPEAAALFDLVSARSGAPLVSGVVTSRLGDGEDPMTQTRWYNTALVWRAGEEIGDFYDKRRPVPFGEYVPDRQLWRQFAPDLIDLIRRDYTPGTTDAVLELDDGVRAGAAICFDIVDDGLMRDMAAQGAQLLLAPTNNGDFGMTIESAQQLEIARVRALELGRAVVNISTVGTSAIILPDGSELDRLPRYEAGIMIEEVPLATTVTPAMAVGAWIELLAALSGLCLLAAAIIVRRPRRL